MAYSAITGTSIVDVFAGRKNDALDARGGSAGTDTAPSTSALSGAVAGGASGGGRIAPGVPQPLAFGGPHADLLARLAGVAQSHFNLTITATTNGAHVPGSYHYSHRAFDCSGTEANMRAFATYVATSPDAPQIAELIHNPGPCIKNGQRVNGAVTYAAVWLGHRDHDHVAA
jgi:hypothetical protein